MATCVHVTLKDWKESLHEKVRLVMFMFNNVKCLNANNLLRDNIILQEARLQYYYVRLSFSQNSFNSN